MPLLVPPDIKCSSDTTQKGDLGGAGYKRNTGTSYAALFIILHDSCECQPRSGSPWSSAPERHTQSENKALVWLPRLPCSRFTGETLHPAGCASPQLHPFSGRATLQESNTP